MISKVIRGKTFYGACRYVCGNEKRSVILEAEGVRDYDYREMAWDFEAQHSLRPGLGKPVFHGILSFYPGEKVEDETMTRIAKDYLKHIGIKDTQYVITKHTDKNHLHLHILANMVNNKGETIKDSYIGLRGKKAAELITIGYKLREAKGKDLAKTNLENLNQREASRYKVYAIIAEQLPKCKTMEELEKALQKKEVETLYKYRNGTSERQGVSFSFGNYKFKGSELDRSFSLIKLQNYFSRHQDKALASDATVPSGASQKPSSHSGKTYTEELYRAKKENNVLNVLLKPAKDDMTQPQTMLPKKRKKKRNRAL